MGEGKLHGAAGTQCSQVLYRVCPDSALIDHIRLKVSVYVNIFITQLPQNKDFHFLFIFVPLELSTMSSIW